MALATSGPAVLPDDIPKHLTASLAVVTGENGREGGKSDRAILLL